MAKRSLHDEWTSYAIRCLPLGCSDTQRKETRRAFHAGALAHQYLLSVHSGDANASDAEVEEYVLSIDRELKEFKEKISRGEA